MKVTHDTKGEFSVKQGKTKFLMLALILVVAVVGAVYISQVDGIFFISQNDNANNINNANNTNNTNEPNKLNSANGYYEGTNGTNVNNESNHASETGKDSEGSNTNTQNSDNLENRIVDEDGTVTLNVTKKLGAIEFSNIKIKLVERNKCELKADVKNTSDEFLEPVNVQIKAINQSNGKTEIFGGIINELMPNEETTFTATVLSDITDVTNIEFDKIE